jgi:hypothetical protein
MLLVHLPYLVVLDGEEHEALRVGGKDWVSGHCSSGLGCHGHGSSGWDAAAVWRCGGYIEIQTPLVASSLGLGQGAGFCLQNVFFFSIFLFFDKAKMWI